MIAENETVSETTTVMLTQGAFPSLTVYSHISTSKSYLYPTFFTIINHR